MGHVEKREYEMFFSAFCSSSVIFTSAKKDCGNIWRISQLEFSLDI